MVYMDKPALQSMTILHAQWSDLDEEVVEEIRHLWREQELGNDYFYISWDLEQALYDQENYAEWFPGEEYPYKKINEYLKEHGINNCLIHFWW